MSYLTIALKIGEGLLLSGAEIRRVEDSITRICLAFGAKEVHVFSLLSLISVTIISGEGETHTQTIRLYDDEMHLSNLEEYNALSRKLCTHAISLEEAHDMIGQLKCTRPLSPMKKALASSITAGSFSFYFGATFLSALCSSLIGFFLPLLDAHRKFPLNVITKTVLFSFVAAFFAFLLHFLFPIEPGLVFIGSAILFIPGLAVSSSFRDLLEGDFISGFLRLLKSVILASAIVLGYIAANLLWR